MAYAAGGVDGDAGTGAATRRSTSGEATLADEGASAITGADRAVGIVDARAFEMATPRDDSRSVLVSGALDASRLRAMVIGIAVDRVAAGSIATSAETGPDEWLTVDASGVCCARRVNVESALRMTTAAGAEVRLVVVGVGRPTKGDAALLTTP
jgi:hypothetical protein